MSHSIRPGIRTFILLGTLGTVATVAHAQQPDPVTDWEVTGKVYEPQPLQPTDARIEALRLPSGFSIHRFAEGLENPRMLAVAADGTVYVTQRTPGNLVMLRDTDSDGIVDVQRVVLRIKGLHGIAIQGDSLYLVDVKRIYVAAIHRDGSVGEPRVLSRNLPDGGQHPNRTLALGPDGGLFVSVGSTCNACMETDSESATLLRVDPFNGERTLFATGLRNTIGFGWHPASGRLYGMDHGIDWLGDDEQSEELNEIRVDARYGWPYIYDEGEFNPQDEPLKITQQEWAERSTNPVAGYTAHAAPMQLAFHDGRGFPSAFGGNAFVAMHGSWNRKPASGYEVVRLQFDSAGTFEGFEPFVTGFLQPRTDTAPRLPGSQPLPAEGYVGRPTGVAVAADGALLIGDDSNNMLYRVVQGTAPAMLPQQLASELLTATSGDPIRVTSTAFASGAPIPAKYTDYGKGLSPPLSWAPLPTGTRSVVLMMEDPDATSPLPFVHWIAFVPPHITELREGIAPASRIRGLPEALQGSNSRSLPGYFGPRPPAGDPPHRYHFQVFALDRELDLPAGYNRHALLKSMQGHVLSKGVLVGTVQHNP